MRAQIDLERRKKNSSTKLNSGEEEEEEKKVKRKDAKKKGGEIVSKQIRDLPFIYPTGIFVVQSHTIVSFNTNKIRNVFEEVRNQFNSRS